MFYFPCVAFSLTIREKNAEICLLKQETEELGRKASVKTFHLQTLCFDYVSTLVHLFHLHRDLVSTLRHQVFFTEFLVTSFCILKS